MNTKPLTPLQLLCRHGIFESTRLIDWTDDQTSRAAAFLAESRIAELPRPKHHCVSDPDRAFLKADIYSQAQKYIYDKIRAVNNKIVSGESVEGQIHFK